VAPSEFGKTLYIILVITPSLNSVSGAEDVDFDFRKKLFSKTETT